MLSPSHLPFHSPANPLTLAESYFPHLCELYHVDIMVTIFSLPPLCLMVFSFIIVPVLLYFSVLFMALYALSLIVIKLALIISLWQCLHQQANIFSLLLDGFLRSGTKSADSVS